MEEESLSLKQQSCDVKGSITGSHMLVALILLLVSSHYQHPSQLDLWFFQQSLPIFFPTWRLRGGSAVTELSSDAGLRYCTLLPLLLLTSCLHLKSRWLVTNLGIQLTLRDCSVVINLRSLQVHNVPLVGRGRNWSTILKG